MSVHSGRSKSPSDSLLCVRHARADASMIIGIEAVANASPDGYTLLAVMERFF